jgi:hypothetical protein
MKAAALAAASEINDELVIILSCANIIRRAYPASYHIVTELELAAERLSRSNSGLLNCADRSGAKASAVSLDRILEMP